MKHFYSILAYSVVSLQYKDPSIIFIEPGMNAFTVLTDNIDAFIEDLKLNGVRVDQVNKLDGKEAHHQEKGKSFTKGSPSP